MPDITPIFRITTIPDIALWLTATPIRIWLRSDIHCQYWKSTVHVTYTIDLQYWQWILKRSLC